MAPCCLANDVAAYLHCNIARVPGDWIGCFCLGPEDLSHSKDMWDRSKCRSCWRERDSCGVSPSCLSGGSRKGNNLWPCVSCLSVSADGSENLTIHLLWREAAMASDLIRRTHWGGVGAPYQVAGPCFLWHKMWNPWAVLMWVSLEGSCSRNGLPKGIQLQKKNKIKKFKSQQQVLIYHPPYLINIWVASHPECDLDGEGTWPYQVLQEMINGVFLSTALCNLMHKESCAHTLSTSTLK